jgi:hypothetical protein
MPRLIAYHQIPQVGQGEAAEEEEGLGPIPILGWLEYKLG